MSLLRLDTFVSGTRVGGLERDRDGRVWFQPDRTWLAEGGLPSLGVAFERDRSPRRAGTGLPVWFEHLLPASGGPLRRRICSAHALRETDGAGLLKVLGRDLPGAIEILGDAHEPVWEPDAPLDLKIGFSLPGMQLKFSLAEAGHRFTLPARGVEGAWIVKLPSEDRPDLPLVEHVTMRWAQAAGFPVPDTRVVPTSDIDGLGDRLVERIPSALAIRRFDRRPDRRRVHQEDFAQALEIGPDHIYGNTGGERVSNDGLLRLVRDAAGEDAAEQFVRRLAFTVASGNTDAHLKNWSFQWMDGLRPRLSPLYDQVATVTWAPYGWQGEARPTLALAIGRCRSLEDLTAKHVSSFADRGGVPAAIPWFDDALRRSRDAWEVVSPSAPEPMARAIQEHWQKVPLLRRL